IPAESLPLLVNCKDYFRYVINMALCIDPPRDSEPYEFHRRRQETAVGGIFTKHNRADFYAAYAPFEVQGIAKCLPGVLEHRYVVHEPAGVEVDRMPSRWLYIRNAECVELLPYILDAPYAVPQVIFVHHFA